MQLCGCKYVAFPVSKIAGPQLKTTACCGHRVDELVFPKDSSWDLGPVTETARP
uniref:Uncharacterized protein n=1 Tax=Heterorhabditis bacteriophora TaxID=37862 RepID=A0A1I7X651_HETBA